MKKFMRGLCFLTIAFLLLSMFSFEANVKADETFQYGPVTGIEWDHTSEVKLSHAAKSSEYGRLCFVTDDIWLTAYSFGPHLGKDGKFWGDGWSSLAIRRSTDGGTTWDQPFIIPVPDGHKGYWRFCTPELIKLKSGRILLAYVGGGNPDDNEHDVFFTRYSDDQGLTWSEPQIIAYGRGWEPAMIQQEDGTIQMFYASEARWWPSSNVQQEILMIESKDDGLTWSKTPKSVAYNPGKRDGMPVPIILDNNKGMAFVIESVGAKNSPYVIWSSNEENWSSPVDPVTGGPDSEHRWLAVKDNIFGGAPYIAQLPTGETILSCHDRGYKSSISHWRKSVAMVYIGDDEVKNFDKLNYPWPSMESKVGSIQNAIYALDAERVLLVSTVVKANDNCEVWMKTGYVMREGTRPIAYNLNEGKNPYGAHAKYTEGTGYTLPIPKREGYAFKGWYPTPDFEGSPVTAIASSDTGDKEFYAKWEEIIEETPTITEPETPDETPVDTEPETPTATEPETPDETPVDTKPETPAETPDPTQTENPDETPVETQNEETPSQSAEEPNESPKTGDWLIYIVLFTIISGVAILVTVKRADIKRWLRI